MNLSFCLLRVSLVVAIITTNIQFRKLVHYYLHCVVIEPRLIPTMLIEQGLLNVLAKAALFLRNLTKPRGGLVELSSFDQFNNHSSRVARGQNPLLTSVMGKWGGLLQEENPV